MNCESRLFVAAYMLSVPNLSLMRFQDRQDATYAVGRGQWGSLRGFGTELLFSNLEGMFA